MSFSDVYLILSFGMLFVLIGFAQGLFFPNVDRNFDPDIFIYYFGAFGIITWFALKRMHAITRKKIILLFFLTRGAIILVEVWFFLLGPYYNEVNEVVYYQHLAEVVTGSPFLLIFQKIKYGIPPGFQGWLIVYQFLLFNNSTGFPRDIAFSTLNLVLEFGILYVMIKMHDAKSFQDFTRLDKEKQKEFFEFGLLFFAISVFSVYYSNVRDFMDPLPIFLALLGLLFYNQGKHGRAALFLSISTLIKFIPILWLLLIIMKFLKLKQYKTAFLYLAIAALTAGCGFLGNALYFQMDLVTYFFKFLQQVYDWSILAGSGLQLNQPFWFVVSDFTFVLITTCSLFVLAVFFVWKEQNGPSLHAFTSIISLYFVFQSWFDQHYVLWIIPLLCLDLMSSRRLFSRLIMLFYVSVFVYIFFLHFVLDLGIDTTLGSSTPLVGNLYRLTGQIVSYIGFFLIPIYHLRQILPRPSVPRCS